MKEENLHAGRKWEIISPKKKSLMEGKRKYKAQRVGIPIGHISPVSFLL